MTIDAELLEGIFTGGWSNILNKYLTDCKSIPLDLIKLGIAHGRADFQNKQIRNYDASRAPNSLWIHALADCEDEGAEEFLEELFYNEPRSKGPCLLALWVRNPEKTVKWLDAIHKFDPNFVLLRTDNTPLLHRIRQKYPVKETAVFNTIYMDTMKTDVSKVDQIIEPLLTTKLMLENEGRLDKASAEKINKITQERLKVIRSKTLSSEHADKLFDVLWDSNIEFKENDEYILQRNLRFVFISIHDGDNWYLKYNQEVEQLIELTPQLSEVNNLRIEKLFDALPFWDKKYQTLSDHVATINPKKYSDSWKSLIQNENEHFSEKRSWSVYSPRPNEDDIVNALRVLSEMNVEGFSEFLISLINHHSENVRSVIQKLLSGEKLSDEDIKNGKKGKSRKSYV